MEHIQSCQTSVYELTTLNAIHLRVYRRQGRDADTKVDADDNLTAARNQLNEHGIFAATDSSSPRLLVFAKSRAELEHQLKPFHRLVGAKVTLACGDDLVLDFENQRDIATRDFLNKDPAEPNAQAASGWQRFRIIVISAMQDFVMSHMRRSCDCVQLDRRCMLLLPQRAATGDRAAHQRPFIVGQDDAARLLIAAVDFVSNGRVLLNMSARRIVKQSLAHSARPIIGLSDQNVLLIPTSLQGRLVAATASPMATQRSCVSEWLQRKRLRRPAIDSDTEWVLVSVDDEAVSVDLSSQQPNIIAWPRRYVFSTELHDSTQVSSIVERCLDDGPDIFRFALEWKRSRPERLAKREESHRLSTQLPPIPADVCRDLPGNSTAPSPDTVMRENISDNQQQGVYPTPSDGMTSHQTPGSFAHDSPYAQSAQPPDPQVMSGAMEATSPSQQDNQNDRLDTSLAQQPALARSKTPGLPGMTDDDFDFFEGPQAELAVDGAVQDNGEMEIDSHEDTAVEAQSDHELFDEQIATSNAWSSGATQQQKVNQDDMTHAKIVSTAEKRLPHSAGRSGSDDIATHKARMQMLNEKYLEHGLYHASDPSMKHEAELKIEAKPTVPQIDTSTDSSSELASQSSCVSVESSPPRDQLTALVRGSGPPKIGGDEARNHEEDVLADPDEVDMASLKAFLDTHATAQDRSLVSTLCDKVSKLDWETMKTNLLCNSSRSAIDGIDLIQIMQRVTIDLAAKRSAPATHVMAESDVYRAITERTRQLSVLDLALAQHHNTSGASLSPIAKRNDQEAKMSLRRYLTPIEPPMVQAQRHGIEYSMLSTAVHFNESLGLGPISGPKNVTALVISPQQRECNDGVSLFHTAMEDAYMSSQLGTYRIFHDQDTEEQGGHQVVRNLTHSSNLSDLIAQYDEAITTLGTKLVEHDLELSSVMLFIVDLSQDVQFKVAMAASYHRLLQLIRDDSDNHSSLIGHRIQYSVIPSAYVNNDITVSLPSLTPSMLNRLASQVYSSFTQSAPGDSPFLNLTDTQPTLQLDTNLPTIIPFELTPQPVQNLFLQDTHLHIAYSFNSHRNWLVTAWTDATGRYGAYRTYPLKHIQLSTILNEIWQSTLAILQSPVGRTIRWRVVLTKLAAFIPEEAKLWNDTIGEQPANVSVFLFSTYTPRFHISIKKVEHAVAPTETPKPSVALNFTSPNTSTPAPTPDAGSTDDSSARLVDLTDQTWSLIMSYQPNTAENPMHYIPSLLSALLIKRRTERDSDAPVCLQVNLMKVMVGAKRRERGVLDNTELVKSVCKVWSDLGVLARAKDEEAKESILPAFMALVDRGLEGLEELVEL